MKNYDVIIIGAGTSGLTARQQVAKKTDNYLVVDGGKLGTTCARVGCMPSKVFIQVANDFHRRKSLVKMGIHGGEDLTVNTAATMKHVRSLRDRFVTSILSGMEPWMKTNFLKGWAKFLDKNTIEVNGEKLTADNFVIAVGSRPVLLDEWEGIKKDIITSDEFFELEELPKSVLVMGLGVVGVELGQALSRLGVKVIGATYGKAIGGLTHPEMQEYAAKMLEKEFEISYDGAKILKPLPEGGVEIEVNGKTCKVDKVVPAIGRKSNADRLNLEAAGVSLNKKGLPDFDYNTQKIKEAPHITFPGDANGDRPILHEAADEGFIAGYNSVNEEQCFKRRVSLGITFVDPNIATVGKRFSEIKDKDIVVGEVSFEGQGRSIVSLKEKGLLKIFVEKESAKILGAELIAPDGEHLAHLISWAISMDLAVFEVLKMPFYHPVVEEGLRTALRSAMSQIDGDCLELQRCQDTPIR